MNTPKDTYTHKAHKPDLMGVVKSWQRVENLKTAK